MLVQILRKCPLGSIGRLTAAAYIGACGAGTVERMLQLHGLGGRNRTNEFKESLSPIMQRRVSLISFLLLLYQNIYFSSALGASKCSTACASPCCDSVVPALTLDMERQAQAALDDMNANIFLHCHFKNSELRKLMNGVLLTDMVISNWNDYFCVIKL